MGRRYNKHTVVKESVIENYLVKEVEKLGGIAIKFNPHNNRGLPDRICFFPGGFLLLVEVKRPGERPRKNQERQLRFFRKLGFQATFADTKGRVDQVLKWVLEYMSKHRMGFHVEHVCYRKDCIIRRDTK
jgi:hypothetical protein